MKIKKGDKVTVLRGKDAGKSGKVLKVMAKKRMVLVEGVNKYKKHVKKQSEQQPGGVVEVERPIDVSKVKMSEVVELKKTTKRKVAK
jgi:large subunit ribosomal protein L24